MKGTLHFFISKIKQDSLELGVILAINLFFMSLLAFIAGPKKLDAQTFQVFLYFNCYVAIFLDLMSFGQKYYLSLPLNRQYTLFNLAVAKLVNFIPCLVIFTLGYTKFPKSDVINSGYVPTVIMLVILAFIINLYTLQYDITKPRIEHAKKKFMYFLVMVKILINYIFFSSIIGYSGAFLYYKGWHEYLNQWHIIVALLSFAILKFFNLLKILLDEKTTYWFWKRDGIQSLLKISTVAVPAIVYSMFFGESKLYDEVPLAAEVSKGNYEKLISMLKDGEDPNQVNRFGMTPVLASVIEGDLKAFRMLVDHGGKIHRDDKIQAPFSKLSGYGALDLAVIGQNEEIIKKLMDWKWNYTNNKNEENILHWMASTCSAPGIFQVLRSGIEIDKKNKQGRTPLHNAVRRNCWPVTIALLQHGADIAPKDKKGKTVFDYAKKRKNMTWFLKGIKEQAGESSRFPASL